jgi:hypothetical protein
MYENQRKVSYINNINFDMSLNKCNEPIATYTPAA